LQTEKKEEAERMLAGAITSFEKSFQYSDKMLEALYNSARCKLSQSQKTAAVNDLGRLFLLDRNYCIRVCNADFIDLKNEIEALIIKMRHQVFIEAEQKYQKIKSLIDELNKLNFIYKNRDRIPSQFTEGLPYFDVLDYNVEFGKIIPELETAIREAKEQIRLKEQERIKQKQRAEEERQAQERYAERQRVEAEETAIKEAKGKKKKLFWFIFRSVLGGIIGAVPFALIPDLEASGIMFGLLFVLWIFIFVKGREVVWGGLIGVVILGFIHFLIIFFTVDQKEIPFQIAILICFIYGALLSHLVKYMWESY
jgi:uncharacterized membrane protein